MSEKYEDEMYEVNDMDADIQTRKELIQQAKELEQEEDLGTALNKAAQLQRQWKSIYSWQSGLEEELRQDFDQHLDQVYAKRNQWYDVVKEKKNDLIVQAKSLIENDNWKEATQKMNELMDQWKASGSAGKKTDDQLWEHFSQARQTFYEKKDQYFKSLRSRFENAQSVKEELIQKAEALKDSDQWQQTSKQFQELMDQWKAVGSAGKEHEEGLWQRFNEARQAFYSKRNEYYEKLHQEQEEIFNQKKGLIQQAKDILSSQQFTRNNTEFMKQLNVKWKELGNAGKKLEDTIWPEFKETLDHYFDGLKDWNENREVRRKERLAQAKSRKQDQIQNQKRQISRLEDDMNGLISETQRNEIEEEIQEKEDFIVQLENEILDIEKRLEQE